MKPSVLAAILPLALMAALFAPPSAAQLREPIGGGALDEPVTTELIPYDVTVNGAAVGNLLLLLRRGTLYATLDTFDEWRLGRPTAPAFLHERQEWFALAAVPGYRAEFNAAEQAVALTFASEAFAATRLVQEQGERPPLTPAIPAAFFNYDLNYTRSSTSGSTGQSGGGLFELGTSGNWGVITSTFLAQNLIASGVGAAPRSFRRLETTYVRDLPDSRLSLRLGDTVTRAASWGRPVYFGGLQIGRNFGLVPGFITQPLPIISGVSAAPSTVELYINDALRQTSRVPAGPFAIDNFPLLTGGGQARVVVRDVLGRETIVIQDFFSHASLLEQGLTDWSFELGAIRNQLGTENADYGQRFTSGLVRFGVNKSLTVESRLELGTKSRGVGLGLVAALPFQVLGQAAVAASQNRMAGNGYLWQGSLTHTDARHGFTFNLQGANPSYRQIGQDDAAPSYRRQLAASYSYNAGSLGSVGIGVAMVDGADRRITTWNGNYSVPIGKSVITLSVVRVRDPKATGGGTSVGLNLFVPLGEGLTASSNVNHRSGATEGFLSVAKGLGTDAGFGWRALTGYRQDEAFVEGGLYRQASDSLTTLDISQSRTRQALRAGIQGGLAWADGRIYTGRRISDAFGIVEVPGYADVGISVYGSVVARTDADGRALIPRLQPYQANDVRLDPTELPISAEIDTIEQRVVPSNRAAVKIFFPVRTGRGALITIVFDDGEPAPAASEIQIVGDKEEFFVARRGEAFLTGLKDINQVTLKWGGAACSFTLTLPPGNPDEIARVGPILCPGIKR